MKSRNRERARIIPLAIMMTMAVGAAAPIGSTMAQDMAQAPVPPPLAKEIPMESTLYQAERIAARVPMPQLRETLADRGIPLRDDGMVYVDIAGPPEEEPLPLSLMAPFGVEFDEYWRGRVVAWVPVHQLSNLARVLPAGYFMEMMPRPQADDVAGCTHGHGQR